MVDCGVEKENAEKAQNEILNLLEIMKSGNFSDSEFDSSLKSITDSLNSYNDSQGLLDLWYSAKIFKDRILSPEDTADILSKITREDVTNIAKGINLHTVYKLLPKEEGDK